MILSSLGVRGFRNLAEDGWSLHPQANLFVGDNGQGKTAVLEAIYFLATTRSFRTSRIANLPNIDGDSTFVRGTVTRGEIAVDLSVGLSVGAERKRELLRNEQPVALHDYLAELQVIAYSASRLDILREGPEARRRFLDRGLAHHRPGYLGELQTYNRALRQRNAVLQRAAEGMASPGELDVWDREWLAAARSVVDARRDYVASLRDRFESIVAAHDYHVTNLSIDYLASGFRDDREDESILERMRARREREIVLGYSLAGPHRDEIRIRVDGRDASEILSSGEQKMTVLFLKFAKLALARQRTGDAPLFLLDDLDAELDFGIIERLLRYLGDSVQLFTTSAKESFLSEMRFGDHAKFVVAGGTVRRAV